MVGRGRAIAIDEGDEFLIGRAELNGGAESVVADLGEAALVLVRAIDERDVERKFGGARGDQGADRFVLHIARHEHAPWTRRFTCDAEQSAAEMPRRVGRDDQPGQGHGASVRGGFRTVVEAGMRDGTWVGVEGGV